MTNAPLNLNFLDKETIEDETIFKVTIKNCIEDILRIKDNTSGTQPKIDMSYLSEQVQRNTGNDYGLGKGIIGGVQCVSISQIIPLSYFVEIYNQTRTRLIKLICLYEQMKFDFDKYDVTYGDSKLRLIKNNNKSFESILVSGSFEPKDTVTNKIFWRIFIPILTGIISAVIATLIVYFITK